MAQIHGNVREDPRAVTRICNVVMNVVVVSGGA